MLQLTGIAVSMLARPATRIRIGSGSYVNGHWVPGAPIPTPIRAAIQPVDPDDLLQLPEGERSEASKAIWTKAGLRTANVDTQIEADRIVADGVTWKVLKIFGRVEAGWTKAIVGRLNA